MDAAVAAADRRQTRRATEAGQHGIVGVKVRPGHAAVVIDVSPQGALIETAHRLLPGTVIDLHVESAGGRESVRARVLRSIVSGIQASGICYRGAIRFESALKCLIVDDEPAPHLGSEAVVHGREANTHNGGLRLASACTHVERT